MISYAQNGEDVLLSRIFPGPTGFYVDVGACHPTIDSVTKSFYDRGWNGINVEPTPRMFDRLLAERGRDKNLAVALSNRPGRATFFECPDYLPLSTMGRETADAVRELGARVIEREVELIRLETLLESHCDREIDFLKIDVEGHELEVLEGGDWNRFRPRVVLVEATSPRSRTPDHKEWESILLESNYLFATFDGLNRFYVRNEDRELMPGLEAPVNVFDKFATYREIAFVAWLQNAIDDAGEAADVPAETRSLGSFVQQIRENPTWLRLSPAKLSRYYHELKEAERSA